MNKVIIIILSKTVMDFSFISLEIAFNMVFRKMSSI